MIHIPASSLCDLSLPLGMVLTGKYTSNPENARCIETVIDDGHSLLLSSMQNFLARGNLETTPAIVSSPDTSTLMLSLTHLLEQYPLILPTDRAMPLVVSRFFAPLSFSLSKYKPVQACSNHKSSFTNSRTSTLLTVDKSSDRD